ncbi:hypothetical protein [Pseudonocardia sp.]|uniref:hypothetical protein n=1 Tax=Pseudonocardia sp. TaxID=60912 RepID=UPI003D0E2D8B
MTQDDQRGAAGDGRSVPPGPGTPPDPATGPGTPPDQPHAPAPDGPTDPRGVPAYQPPPGHEPGPARPGRIRHQDEHTRPREPTLAERRARDQARRRAIEEQIAAAQAADTKRKRRRILIGTGVTVGVVAVIALAYAVSDDDEVEARCVDENNVVVDDANCVTPVASGDQYHGGALVPIFIGAGGRQYHYNYGGSGTVGQPVSGGTTSVPKSSTKVTSGTSGKTLSGGSSYSYSGGSSSSSSGSDSVKRGGLGVSGGGSKSGSSSSGS